MAAPPENPLQKPLTQLRGVGPERAAQLARLNLRTIEDLLLHRPNRYEDRRKFRRIADLKLNEPTITHGKIVACGLKRWKGGSKSIFEFILEDGSARLHCRWWNLPFMENYFQVGDEVVVFGKPLSLKPRTIDHPETEVIDALEKSVHLNRIVPIYPLTEGLPQRWLRSLIWRTLSEFEAKIPEPKILLAASRDSAGKISPDDKNPALSRGAATFPERANAIHMLHFPEELNGTEIARRRLAFDEFVELQTAIQLRRKKLEANARALPCAGDHNRFIKPFLAQLGFELTEAQKKVLREIRHDMGGQIPMRRLLQGDVGSGKTAVAACGALMALESGFNVALMAPTEILAEQHWQNFRRWFESLGIAVELLTGARKTMKPVAQASSLQVLRASLPADSGGTDAAQTRRQDACATLFIGTHALIEESFAPEKLGLVIIDEQHKFGVAQREKLLRKGIYPHLLVMTATPIPRTLGLTLYGDLDISVIDEMPAGRGRIKTFLRNTASLPKVWEFIRSQLKEGRQAYVVYPRLEEADLRTGLKAVMKELENLQKVFAPNRVAVLHGQLKSAEKEKTMAEFRENKIQVLLATSVIEVGLDVSNATVMLIENAERFGLAQLHQLRGRIGRGAAESFCILIAAAKTEDARARLKILEETTDGFRIAEADLKLRGPGEFLGSQQSGAPPLRFGDLLEDRELVERARALVKESLKEK